MKRRYFLNGVVAFALVPPPQNSPAQTVTVVVDFSPTGNAAADANDTRFLETEPSGLITARAVRNPKTRQVSVTLQSTSDKAALVRLDTRLGSGLWRIEAASVQNAPIQTDPTTAPKAWRMESVLKNAPGSVIKTLPVGAGQTLFLQFGETVREAENALQILQKATASVGVTTYSGESVPSALARVGDTLEYLPALIAKNDRAGVVKRVHRALLTLAQAEAMAQNAQQARINEHDAQFDALTLALSEISCASWNLVPRQTIEGPPEKPVLLVSATNAGTRTLPLLSLAVEGASEGVAQNARPVFRGIAPGTTVSARFLLRPDETATVRGVAQFIVDMGAARVYAVPIASELLPAPEPTTSEN